jgi:hypothetical protein
LEDKKIEAELLQIIGLKRLDKLSKEEASTILKLIGEQRLKEAHIQALVRLAPGFIAVATEALRVQMKVIAAAKEVQQDVVQTISAAVEGISQALKILVGSAESDATREKLAAVLLEAGQLYLQLAIILQQVNANNNEMYKTVAKMATIALIVVVGVFLTATSTKREPS